MPKSCGCNIREYIKEELNKALKEQHQLALPFKSNPVQVLTQYIEEKEDELEDTLAEIEMLINDHEKEWAPGLTNRARMLLSKIEVDGKTQIMKIKALRKLINLMQPKQLEVSTGPQRTARRRRE